MSRLLDAINDRMENEQMRELLLLFDICVQRTCLVKEFTFLFSVAEKSHVNVVIIAWVRFLTVVKTVVCIRVNIATFLATTQLYMIPNTLRNFTYCLL